MAMQFTVSITGTPTEADKHAAQYAVDTENARRAALDPPGTPLPSGTAIQLRDSYQTILGGVNVDIHAHNLAQSDTATLQEFKDAWPNATDAQRQAALTALTT